MVQHIRKLFSRSELSQGAAVEAVARKEEAGGDNFISLDCARSSTAIASLYDTQTQGQMHIGCSRSVC